MGMLRSERCGKVDSRSRRSTVELPVARMAERVRRGGHAVPEDTVRRRIECLAAGKCRDLDGRGVYRKSTEREAGR